MLEAYQEHVRTNQIMYFYCVVMLSDVFLTTTYGKVLWVVTRALLHGCKVFCMAVKMLPDNLMHWS